MKTMEAYELTLEKLDELREKGIEISMKPSRSRNNEETIKKYSGKERIPSDKWFHVTFKVQEKDDSIIIHEMANYLGMCGISFDTGGCREYRDWELDWSFKYTGKEDENWRNGREEVEDIINNEL